MATFASAGLAAMADRPTARSTGRARDTSDRRRFGISGSSRQWDGDAAHGKRREMIAPRARFGQDRSSPARMVAFELWFPGRVLVSLTAPGRLAATMEADAGRHHDPGKGQDGEHGHDHY